MVCEGVCLSLCLICLFSNIVSSFAKSLKAIRFRRSFCLKKKKQLDSWKLLHPNDFWVFDPWQNSSFFFPILTPIARSLFFSFTHQPLQQPLQNNQIWKGIICGSHLHQWSKGNHAPAKRPRSKHPRDQQSIIFSKYHRDNSAKPHFRLRYEIFICLS